jgi:hypothetical protein
VDLLDEAVEDAYVIIALEERARDIPSDEARSTGDEDPFRH